MVSQGTKHVLVMTVLVVSDRNPNQINLCRNKRDITQKCRDRVRFRNSWIQWLKGCLWDLILHSITQLCRWSLVCLGLLQCEMSEVPHAASLLLSKSWPGLLQGSNLGCHKKPETRLPWAASPTPNQTPPFLAPYSLGWYYRRCFDAHFVWEISGFSGDLDIGIPKEAAVLPVNIHLVGTSTASNAIVTLTSCVTSRNWVNLFEPQFPLSREDKIIS